MCLAKQTAASAMSGVRSVADETRHVRELVEATSVEARSIRGEVESKVATLVGKADASTTHVVEEITGRVQEVAAYSDAQALRVTAEVTQ